MPAPIVGFFVAFLTGAALPVATAEATLGGAAKAVIVIDGKAATVYGKLPAICAATDPALDRLSDAADAARAKSRWRAILAAAADRVARDADIICNDAKAPNTPAGRLRAAAAALRDIAIADGLVPPAKAAVVAPAAAQGATGACGRSRC
ncbi:MAG: hypothetical protein ABSF67_20425 [Roseiarcus sp.]|jgi:hypothetical protein